MRLTIHYQAGERDADDIKDRPVVKEARLLRRLHEIYDARFEEPTTSIDSYDGSDSVSRLCHPSSVHPRFDRLLCSLRGLCGST